METSERKGIGEFVPYDEPDKHPNRIEWITTRERAEHLVSKGLVRIIGTIEETKKENKKIDTKKTEKKKK